MTLTNSKPSSHTYESLFNRLEDEYVVFKMRSGPRSIQEWQTWEANLTTKDFLFMANIIREMDVDPVCRIRATATFADKLAASHERFDKMRFIKACLTDETDQAAAVLLTK